MNDKLRALILTALSMIGVIVVGFILANLIMLLVAGHSREVLVPNVLGMDVEVARQKLMQIGLYLEEGEQQYSSDFKKGEIIAQKPLPNMKTKKSRTISVEVSLGPEQIRVPHLENATISEASLRLQNVGLQLGEQVLRYSDRVEKGKVMSSSPGAEEMVGKGTKVNVRVSLGKLQSPVKKDKYWDMFGED